MQLYTVDVFPEPVGPVTMVTPLGELSDPVIKSSSILVGMPSSSTVRSLLILLMILKTIFSP